MSNTRECPFCAETIQAKAKLCKHCKSSVEPFYVKNPAGNSQICRIIDLVESGKNFATTANDLNVALDFRIPSNEAWTPEQVEKTYKDFASPNQSNTSSSSPKKSTGNSSATQGSPFVVAAPPTNQQSTTSEPLKSATLWLIKTTTRIHNTESTFLKQTKYALLWLLGLTAVFYGLMALQKTIIGGLCLLTIAIILIPFSWNFILTKLSLNTTRAAQSKLRAVTSLALLIAFNTFLSDANIAIQTQQAIDKQNTIAAEAQQRKNETIEYFNKNKQELLNTLKQEIQAKNFSTAINNYSKYNISNDTDLLTLLDEAGEQLNSIKKQQILDYIATKEPPTSENLKSIAYLSDLKNKYGQLISLDKSNTEYKKLQSYYSQLADERASIEKRISENIPDEVSIFSICTEEVKSRMKNPSSADFEYPINAKSYRQKNRGDGVFRGVSKGYFTATNGFGGTIRSRFHCELTIDILADTYTIDILEIQ